MTQQEVASEVFGLCSGCGVPLPLTTYNGKTVICSHGSSEGDCSGGYTPPTHILSDKELAVWDDIELNKAALGMFITRNHAKEIKELLQQYHETVQALQARMPKGIVPGSVDYENLQIDNPALADDLEQHVNTLQEIIEELTILKLQALSTIIAGLPPSNLHYQWEAYIAGSLFESPEIKQQLITAVSNIIRAYAGEYLPK